MLQPSYLPLSVMGMYNTDSHLGPDIWAIGDDSLQYVISEFMQYYHYFRS